MQISPQRSRAALIFLTLIAGALRIAYPIAIGRLGEHSEDRYLEYVVAARRLVAHGTFLSPWPVDDNARVPSAIMPPGYTGLVAGTYTCFGVDSKVSTILLQFLNIAATTSIVPLIFLTTRRLADTRAAWIAALTVSINPLLIGFSDYIWDTAIFSFFVALAAYVSVRIAQTGPSLPSMFAFGLFLGGIALFNPALTIAYPLLVLWPLFQSKSARAKAFVSSVAASVVGFGIIVSPWIIRNYTTFDRFIYIRNGLGLQLWLGVCPEASDGGDSVWRHHYPMQNETLASSGEFTPGAFEMEYLDKCLNNAVTSIKSDPARWTRLSLRRASDYWLGTTMTHSGGAIPSRRSRRLVMLFIMGEVLLMIMLALFLRRVPRHAGWLILICVLFSMVYCLTITKLRFRAPMEPFVAIIVALYLRQLWRSGPDVAGASSAPGQNEST
ncbi:MAG: hypothetical protein MI923_09425 [Phycisphaerales bacterium]|nr:hypothetical protein [Phycisphaerales bacterium]